MDELAKDNGFDGFFFMGTNANGFDEPKKYGRLVKDYASNLTKIVEYKDATNEELEIKETIEEGIACYIGYLNGNSMYFYLLKDLIEDNKDTLSPDVMIDTALNLLKELCQQHEVCADYAIKLAEYCVTRDSSLISKLEQVYYNAKNHYCRKNT